MEKINSFAEKIRNKRISINITQEDLAERIRCSGVYVSLMEQGKRIPSDMVVMKLADSLGIDRKELLIEKYVNDSAVNSVIKDLLKSCR